MPPTPRGAWQMVITERQVIVWEYRRPLPHRSRPDGLARAIMLGHGGLRRTVVPPPEHHQLPRPDLGHVPGRPVAIFVGTVLDLALDVDAISPAEVLLRDLGEVCPRDHTVPFRPLLRLTVAVGPVPVRRHGEAGHLGPIRRGADLGIGAEVPDEQGLVE